MFYFALLIIVSIVFFQVLPHEKLEERIQLAKPSSDFPPWWECGKHDKDLLIGVSKYVLVLFANGYSVFLRIISWF